MTYTSLQQLTDECKRRLIPVAMTPGQVQAEVNLILEVLAGLDPAMIWKSPELEMPSATCQRIETLLKKRVEERIPIQYLLSQGSFYGMTFHVSPAVLIPRPETELLVERALTLIRKKGYHSILDIGTGSGAIALSIACHTGAEVAVTATDISPSALQVAKENARRLCPGRDALTFKTGNLFEPVDNQRFELILSNPPYLDECERETLTPEVRNHEPEDALFVKEGRYFYYEHIARQASRFLTPGGTVLVEMGLGMSETISGMFTQNGFQPVEMIDDYAGIPRHLEAHWPG